MEVHGNYSVAASLKGGSSKCATAVLFRPTGGQPVQWEYHGDTLWQTNIAMENGPFIDGLSIRNGDFPWLC